MQDQQEVATLKKVEESTRELIEEAERAEFWIGNTQNKNLIKARRFIDGIEMLTDLCIYKPNRIIDIDDKKKKKKNDDEDEEEEDNHEFLNLSELTQEWDNEDPKVCNDEEVNDFKNQTLLRNKAAHNVSLTVIKQQGLDEAEDKNSFLKVLEKCYIFLIKFVKNNSEN